jgi:hypothetical protein
LSRKEWEKKDALPAQASAVSEARKRLIEAARNARAAALHHREW